MTPSTDRVAPGYRPGDHVCHSFQDESDRESALIPFLREGLLRGERCIYAAPTPSLARTEERLRDAGVDVARARARRALVLMPADEIYGAEGRFDEDHTIALIGNVLDQSLADGYTGLRGSGQTGYPLGSSNVAAARAYELRVTATFGKRPFAALCSYSRQLVGDELAVEMLHTHPKALIDGDLCANPYFDPAGESEGPIAGAGAAAARLAEMMLHIRRRHQTETRHRRMLEALAEEAAKLSRALASERAVSEERAAALAERDYHDAAVAEALERHIEPLRAEVQTLRRSVREGLSPQPTGVLDHAERMLVAVRGLGEIVNYLRGFSPGRRGRPES